MSTSEQSKGFVVRCKNYFGLLPGQTLRDFAAELKALSLEDKQEMAREFNELGMPTDMPK